MAKYDIKCHDCGNIEERSLPIGQINDLEPCEQCGSEEVKVHIGKAPATIYKGSGWFSKDGSYNKQPKVTKTDVSEYERSGKAPLRDYDATVMKK